MIIGISGKIGSGKDTIGKIIQYLTWLKFMNYNQEERPFKITEFDYQHGNFKIVKFADALKDIICILTGCSREQLEDNNFKNSKLPVEWSNYIYYRFIDSHLSVKYINTIQKDKDYIFKEYTYRDLLQILGTDLLRNQLHENVWVNALMSKYKPVDKRTWQYPNWIITDCRFENEAKAIKDRGGIIIRVNREDITGQYKLNPHTSETALDDYNFDYIINNNDTIEELIEKVKEVLIKLKIIKL